MKDPRFPELDYKQIRTLKKYGEVEHFSEETKVFELGQLEYDFFVILKGRVRIVDPTGDDRLIVNHGKNEFTGDSGMLSNRGAQFNAIAVSGTTLLRLKPEQLKLAISQHSDISEVLLNAFLLRQETVLAEYVGGMKLIGSGKSKKTYELRDFMEKNHIWHTFLDVDTNEEATGLLETFKLKKDDLPILINAGAKICLNPNLKELAEHAGVLVDFDDEVFDVLIIGAGPAGLAASVYAASEGLKTVTIDSSAPGGQAGKSSKIENYLGFPTGISGYDLANRAYIQAQKFGCKISIPQKAEKIAYHDGVFTLCVSNGKEVRSKTVITATGADYSKLPIEDIERFEGAGVYYSATGMNVNSCRDELVGIVGGGNSAGQAALYLAAHARKVYVILRSNDLRSKMSNYLVQRIEAAANIEVKLQTEVKELHGDTFLEAITWEDAGGNREKTGISNLFTFIGARPCTSWLSDIVATDKRGFICTGPSVNIECLSDWETFKKRPPQTLEGSVPGFFAVGDVRHGSVKRVASAVGEGSMVVSQVHTFLQELEGVSV